MYVAYPILTIASATIAATINIIITPQAIILLVQGREDDG